MRCEESGKDTIRAAVGCGDRWNLGAAFPEPPERSHGRSSHDPDRLSFLEVAALAPDVNWPELNQPESCSQKRCAERLLRFYPVWFQSYLARVVGESLPVPRFGSGIELYAGRSISNPRSG